jgi:hypothetical protein
MVIGVVVVQQHLRLLNFWLSLAVEAVAVHNTQTVLVAVEAREVCVLQLLVQQAVVVPLLNLYLQ